MIDIITLPSITSTNTYIKEHLADAPHATVVSAVEQTAGRGQRGNSWEAAPGLNLTFSILLRPTGIPASRQFAISRAVSIAIVRELATHLPDPQNIAIKWPNDIYYSDSKICGILIENVLDGSTIARSIVGVGLNVNQREFTSSAPNPVSMAQIAGHTFSLEPLLRSLAWRIIALVDDENRAKGSLTADAYHAMLWRREGYHTYRTRSGTILTAAIHSVSEQGVLTLLTAEGSLLAFDFKQIAPVIGQITLAN